MPLPEGVSCETGAQLGIPGLTATHCVLGGGSVAGKTVLVHGGAGSVGYLAVQLANWGGARVIATASPADFDKVRLGGASTVLDYRSATLAEDINAAAAGLPVERIVDVEFGTNIAVDAEIIAPNGVISVYGSQKEQAPTLPFHALLFKAVTIDIALIYILPDAPRHAATKALHAALADGALDCPVDRVFTLTQTADAHESVEQGGRNGATLVDATSL